MLATTPLPRDSRIATATAAGEPEAEASISRRLCTPDPAGIRVDAPLRAPAADVRVGRASARLSLLRRLPPAQAGRTRKLGVAACP